MPDRKDERSSERWKSEEIAKEVRRQGTPNTANFETQVSDINTDPDAGFDFDMTPTDEADPHQSER